MADAVGRGVGDAGLAERFLPFATLAAGPAVENGPVVGHRAIPGTRRARGVPVLGRIHARQRPLEGHGKLDTETDHVGLVQRRERRGDLDWVIEAQRSGSCHRRQELRPRVGEGIAMDHSGKYTAIGPFEYAFP